MDMGKIESRFSHYDRVFLVTLIATTTVSLLVSVLFLLAYRDENWRARRHPLSGYELGENTEITYHIEPQLSTEKNAQVISGWVTENNKFYEYFNYGIDLTRTSAYNHVQFALIHDDTVIVLPTRVEKDDNLKDILNDGINREWSKFISILPNEYSDDYEKCGMGFVVNDYDGKEILYIIK